MRGDQRTDQQGSDQLVAESEAHRGTGGHRYGEGREAEGERSPLGQRELLEVDFQANEEHQQQLAELGKETGDVCVARYDAQKMRSHDDADEDVSDAIRQPQAWACPPHRHDTEQENCKACERREVERAFGKGHGAVGLLVGESTNCFTTRWP